jgi:hypothetical protein
VSSQVLAPFEDMVWVENPWQTYPYTLCQSSIVFPRGVQSEIILLATENLKTIPQGRTSSWDGNAVSLWVIFFSGIFDHFSESSIFYSSETVCTVSKPLSLRWYCPSSLRLDNDFMFLWNMKYLDYLVFIFESYPTSTRHSRKLSLSSGGNIIYSFGLVASL